MKNEYVAVIEADHDVASLCRKILRSGGFISIRPSLFDLSSIKAFFERNQGAIKAVICAGEFRGFNGADVVRVIREVDQEILIVAISSDFLVNSAMMAAGATVSLPKPFDNHALLGVVTQACA